MYEKAWLNYQQLKEDDYKLYIQSIGVNKTLKEDVRIQSALKELEKANAGFYNQEVKIEDRTHKGIVLDIVVKPILGEEGYEINFESSVIRISSQSPIGILYGTYCLLEHIRCQRPIEELAIKSIPDNKHRMLNHWDNMDGSIERGYSGNSFFFEENQLIISKRLEDYARLMASIHINGIVINNVNVIDEATYLITDKHSEPLIELTNLFYRYGIKLYLSINYAAPMDIGGLKTADPLDELVIQWWEDRSKKVFQSIPNFGGYLVKADSEGRKGPFSYNRTQADGANMLAKAVAPYGGLIIWRCFVYNCQQDWRDTSTDRAKAGYEAFKPLDGSFDDNVILQIKNGPMDFQVREPISPLFGAMSKTNQFLEVQLAQEYTGQQKHVCYLVPMWKEILEFDTHYHKHLGQVKDVVSGKTYNRHEGGLVGVTNTGNDPNWTGHDLAGANLFGFGKIAWNTSESSEKISEQWAFLTFGVDKALVTAINTILLESWPAYESYTSPLGIGWMVNHNHHYGPNVDGYEYDRWGTYHKADHIAIGVDRTDQGTGYSRQYHLDNEVIYNDVDKCPTELLLFFHRLEYTYLLLSGSTLIQHIYETHFEGAQKVKDFLKTWETLEHKLTPIVYERVKERLGHQVFHSELWRDVVNSYFYRKTGIDDDKGRKMY